MALEENSQPDQPDTRDSVRLWLEKNGHFDLSSRIAFVPDEIISQLIGKTAEQAEKILTDDGY